MCMSGGRKEEIQYYFLSMCVCVSHSASNFVLVAFDCGRSRKQLCRRSEVSALFLQTFFTNTINSERTFLS